jgi:hypothetical protein
MMRSSFFLLCALLATAAGCAATTAPPTGADRFDLSNPSHPPLHAHCIVQLKRDVLGAGGNNLPIGPTIETINGASVSVGGRLLRLDREWVVLDTGTKKLWVPRENVLLLQF